MGTFSRVLTTLAFLSDAVSHQHLSHKGPTLRLQSPAQQVDFEFNRIRSVRELRDGGVLVLDPPQRDRQLLLADFRSKNVTPIGRTGGGPSEYRYLISLVSLGGDISLVSDAAQRRALLLDGASIQATLSGGAGLPMGTLLAGGDRLGRVVTLQPHKQRQLPLSRNTAYADSVLVILTDPKRRTADTVARIRGGAARVLAVRPPAPAGTPGTYIVPNPLAVAEQALLFPDGWIGLARLEPYRAEGIWLGTFHAICARILRRDGQSIGLTRSFTIYDRADQMALVKTVLKRLDLDEKRFSPAGMLAWIGQRKDERADVATAAAYYDEANRVRADSWIPPYNLACLRALNGAPADALPLLSDAIERGLLRQASFDRSRKPRCVVGKDSDIGPCAREPDVEALEAHEVSLIGVDVEDAAAADVRAPQHGYLVVGEDHVGHSQHIALLAADDAAPAQGRPRSGRRTIATPNHRKA